MSNSEKVILSIFILAILASITYISAGGIREAARITQYCRGMGYIGYETTGARLGPAGPMHAYCVGEKEDGTIAIKLVPQELIGLSPFK